MKLNIYIGYYEAIVTPKILGAPYAFFKEVDVGDTEEIVGMLSDYPSAEIVYDECLRDELDNMGDTTQYANLDGNVATQHALYTA